MLYAYLGLLTPREYDSKYCTVSPYEHAARGVPSRVSLTVILDLELQSASAQRGDWQGTQRTIVRLVVRGGKGREAERASGVANVRSDNRQKALSRARAMTHVIVAPNSSR